jgi:hypothetical protein
MKIQVKIKPREEYNKENLDWSKPVDIYRFILDPYEVEFEWEDGSTLPYKDFLFFGNEYYYKIFINDKGEGDFERYLE